MVGRRLSDTQRLDWLRLIRTPNVGPASFRNLIGRFGSAEAAIAMLPELAANGGARAPVSVPSLAQAEAEMELARKADAAFHAIGEPDYPAMLRQMDQPPPLVAIKGDARVFNAPAVGIVGARNASLSGIKMARVLAGDLGGSGYAVVSGLARGIDTAAHTGSIATGTVAVLAGGLDLPYPPENIGLSQDIAASGGALISEMPFGWEARAQDFPRRNRLIAALGLGLVVVEAAMRSGSLITARLATEMGRLVFAVPGSPLDPRCSGSNGLLKDGATLVTEAADIEQQVRPLLAVPPTVSDRAAPPSSLREQGYPAASAAPPDESDRGRLIEALGPTPTGTDDLIRHTGLSPAHVQSILVELELAGRLERHSGGAVSLVIGA